MLKNTSNLLDCTSLSEEDIKAELSLETASLVHISRNVWLWSHQGVVKLWGSVLWVLLVPVLHTPDPSRKTAGTGVGSWAAGSAPPCGARSVTALNIPWDWGVQGQHSHILQDISVLHLCHCSSHYVPWCSCWHLVQQGQQRDCAFCSRGNSNIKIYWIFIQCCNHRSPNSWAKKSAGW